jgi:2-oxoglutarate dehydrogenase E2 component (dihydrolipoamide succinyltransferase)
MKIEVKIPSPGESIEQVEIAEWLVKDGDIVEKDQTIAEMESEKATISLVAEQGGKIQIVMPANESVNVGETACIIDTEFVAAKTQNETVINEDIDDNKTENQEISTSEPTEKVRDYERVKISPVAKKMMEENNLSIEKVMAGLHRITKKDIELVLNSANKKTSREFKSIKISPLRRKLSEKLVSVQQETAMLTTFNEIDMSELIALREKYKQKFIDAHGVKPGFMSFFTKAVSIALQDYPMINSAISGDEIIIPDYVDIGIAVQTPKGLMVPVLRDVNNKDIAGLEKEIQAIAEKARENKISLDELKGGTFSITNGGVFGSLFSTPIINPPQSAILGMHTIQDRPVAIAGEVKIRPMMYVALSYDHRLIDGKDSVGFIKIVKSLIENPLLIASGKTNLPKFLLGL